MAGARLLGRRISSCTSRRKPPRSIFRSIASHLNRKILYVPIGQLSPTKLKKLSVVHVLDSYARRAGGEKSICGERKPRKSEPRQFSACFWGFFSVWNYVYFRNLPSASPSRYPPSTAITPAAIWATEETPSPLDLIPAKRRDRRSRQHLYRRYLQQRHPRTDAQRHHPDHCRKLHARLLYIADTLNQRIRQVSLNGNIQTIAGDGQAGYSGDGGPALNARFFYPKGVAVNPAGAVYVVDWENNVVRLLTPSATGHDRHDRPPTQ